MHFQTELEQVPYLLFHELISAHFKLVLCDYSLVLDLNFGVILKPKKVVEACQIASRIHRPTALIGNLANFQTIPWKCHQILNLQSCYLTGHDSTRKCMEALNEVNQSELDCRVWFKGSPYFFPNFTLKLCITTQI